MAAPGALWLVGSRQATMTAVAELIVITGPPGAGKTTVARALSAMYEPSALVAGDDFFAFIDRGYLAPWTGAAHRQNEVVIAAAAAAAGRLVTGGYYVIYDGVIGPWFLDAFAAETRLVAMHYVMLFPPEATCLERVRSRVGHGFTDQAAAGHMYREFADAAIDPRHILADTGAPDALAASIRRLVDEGAVARRACG